MGDLRPLDAPFLVAGPSGRAITTRLRVTPAEDAVLSEVAELVSVARRRDLAERCRLGAKPDKTALAARKRTLTVGLSSRWAGSIVRHNDNQFRFSRRSQARHMQSLRSAIAKIEARLAAPAGGHAEPPPGTRRRKKIKGYASRWERAMKQRRHQVLVSTLARVERDWATGRVHVVEGGARLLRTRSNLDVADLTAEQWRESWGFERTWFHANGSGDEPFGNLTITITPDGLVSIRLPKALEAHANAPRGRYVLSQTVAFKHRSTEWATAIANGAMSYRFHRRPNRDGWYVTASWTQTTQPLPVREGRVLGVDTNADHFAAHVLDASGNPVGRPIRIRYDLTGRSTQRDATLRHAISKLTKAALARECQFIAIENLDFDDARDTGRETMGRSTRGKQFRRTVAGIPTAQVRNRLAAMTAQSGVPLIAVDPAYTSQWGATYWQTHPKMSRHDAAAIVIGRRSLGHAARRRKGKPVTRPEDRARETTNQTSQPRVDTRDESTATTPPPTRVTVQRTTNTPPRSRATVTPTPPPPGEADNVQQNQ